MNAGTITALIIAISGLLGAITALLHSIQTRKQINPPTPPPK